MSDERRAQVDAALAAMQEDFRGELPGRMQRLCTALDRAREDAGDTGALRDATKEAHNLRGTGGTLGLVAIGEAGGQMEEVLVRIAEGDASAWDDVGAALDVLILAVRA